jgi:hypothetical protein
MKRLGLLLRNLAFYRHTNLPIVAGAAIAAAVLSGALLVGQSVRESLRQLLYERIGATEYLVTAEHFFSEDLAARLTPGIDSCPIIYLKGSLFREKTGVRSHAVNVYGVDDRFWKFHVSPRIFERTRFCRRSSCQAVGSSRRQPSLARRNPQTIPRIPRAAG